MRTFTIPAMYGPLIVDALKHLVEVRVDGHQAMERNAAKYPDDAFFRDGAGLMVDEAMIDRSQSGDLVITIAAMPADSDVLAFPPALKVAS